MESPHQLGPGDTAVTASWSGWEQALEPHEGGMNSPQHSLGREGNSMCEGPSAGRGNILEHGAEGDGEWPACEGCEALTGGEQLGL